MGTVRLNKRLKDLGFASRRKGEEFIRQGFVMVNGVVIKDPAFPVDEDADLVTVSEALKKATENFKYIAYYKPAGVTSTFSENEGRGLSGAVRGLSYAGRLDKESEGLMLFSDDGPFVNSIMSPSSRKEKEYQVTVTENVHEGALAKLRGGLRIDGRMTREAMVEKTSPRSFTIVITEGRNRQVRKMAAKVGLTVTGLVRSRIGTVTLRGMKPGEQRPLSDDEVRSLRSGLSGQ